MSSGLKLSLLVRRSTLASYNTVKPIRLFRSSCCENGRLQDVTAQTLISRQQPFAMLPREDLSLMSRIHACTTQLQLFQLINQKSQNMSAGEAVRALVALHTLDNMENEHLTSISSTKEFAMLCETLKRKVRQLSNHEALSALKVLNDYRIPSSTVIVQMLLQMISSSVNDLSIGQITFLNFLLSKCQKTPLVESLSIALPLVLRLQIKTQLDPENVKTLVSLLRFLMNSSDKSDSISVVLNALNKVDESLIEPNHARTIIATIAHLDCADTAEGILRKCHKVLTDPMDNIDPNDLTAIVDITCQPSSDGYGAMCNGSTLDKYAMAIISKDMGFRVAMRVLRRLNLIGHEQNSLLDYIAAKWLEKKKMGEKIDTLVAGNIIAGISLANHKPAFWDSVWEDLLDERLLKMAPETLISIALHLASMNYYWPELLETIFTDERSYTEAQRMKSRFFLLCHAVRTHYPKYNGPWPSDEVMELCRPSRKWSRKKFPFKSTLERVLGGSQYVITGIETVLGYNIDHVIIMRKDGLPHAINNPGKPILCSTEDLEQPKDGQVILFLYTPQDGYVRNTGNLKAYFSLLKQTLESKTNYTIIPINYNMMELPESERVKYISQVLKLKCDEFSPVSDL